MQTGKPPKQPDTMLATAKTLLYVFMSPKFPPPLYLLPLL